MSHRLDLGPCCVCECSGPDHVEHDPAAHAQFARMRNYDLN